MSIFWRIPAIATLCMLLPAVASAGVVATKCSGCGSELQWQQKAIGQGVGQRYLYDFSSRSLRKYDVVGTYEPELRRYVYFATASGVESAYTAYFLDAADVVETSGGLAKAVIVDLQAAVGSGHSGDSVFDMFYASGGATTFGLWLGDYMTRIPLEASVAAVQDLIQVNPGITFSSNPARIDVTVKFKDGFAEFKISADERRYELSKAFDADGNQVVYRDNLRSAHYDFPRGPNSPSYLGWDHIMWHWNLHGHWSCGTASGGGSSSVTCVYMP